jgi:hypothetical protein
VRREAKPLAARSSYSVPPRGARQGLTLVHLSTQRKRFWWDNGYLRGVQGVFKAWAEGVFGRLGDMLSVRNGSG